MEMSNLPYMQPFTDQPLEPARPSPKAVGPGARSRSSYAFNAMSVGQALHMDDFKKSQSARVAAIQSVKRNQLDWKFGIRKTPLGWLILRLR